MSRRDLTDPRLLSSSIFVKLVSLSFFSHFKITYTLNNIFFVILGSAHWFMEMVWSHKEKAFSKVVIEQHHHTHVCLKCCVYSNTWCCVCVEPERLYIWAVPQRDQLCMKIQLGCASISIPDGVSLTGAIEFDCSSIAGHFPRRGSSSGTSWHL